VGPGQRIDPLIHYAGRANVSFTGPPGKTTLQDLKAFIDRPRQTVRSSTRELTLDYGKGVLTLNASSAQGASGDLKRAGAIELGDVTIQSELDNAHIVLVSLDGEPLRSSRRMLLQVMSEERPTDFAAEQSGEVKRITNLGRDPWQVKALQGSVKFKGEVQIQPLDFNGYPAGSTRRGSQIELMPETLYYSVTR
jgi:hypothetical protein